METDIITIGLSLIAGGLAYDKIVNGGKVTDKVVSAVGGGTSRVTETIREIAGGEKQIVKEQTIKEILTPTIPNNLSNPFETIKEKTSSLGETVKEKTSNFSDWFNNISTNTNKKINFDNFKTPKVGNNSTVDRGLLGWVSDKLGVTWAGNTLNNLWDSAINTSVTFYSGAYNIGTIAKGAVTGQKYKTKFVNGQALRYSVESENKSSGFKSSKKSSSSSRKSRTKYVKTSKEAKKYLGNKKINSVVIKDSKGEIKGSYNNRRRQSLNASTTKTYEKLKDSPLKKIFGGF